MASVDNVQALENLARTESDNGNHFIAARHYKLAAKTCKESNKYRAIGLYVKSASEYEQQAQECHYNRDHGDAGVCYRHAAGIYKALGSNLKAKWTYGKAAQLLEQGAQEFHFRRDHYSASTCYILAADVYIKLGNIAGALEIREKLATVWVQAAQENKSRGDHYSAGIYYSHAAIAYKALNYNFSAMEMYLDAATEFEAAENHLYANKMRTKAAKLIETESRIPDNYSTMEH